MNGSNKVMNMNINTIYRMKNKGKKRKSLNKLKNQQILNMFKS